VQHNHPVFQLSVTINKSLNQQWQINHHLRVLADRFVSVFSREENSTMAPNASFLGLHHIKFPSANWAETVKFYTTHFPFKRIPEFDHKRPDGTVFAVILVHEESKLNIEIRDDPEVADKSAGWDPVTYSVQSKTDLDKWHDYFEDQGIKHSPVFIGHLGWLLACEDPAGRQIRLYSLDTHPWVDDIPTDDYWRLY
jgi:catechol 2,3-dioxygenase-like lactoylglutathione lyase family enzyme